MCCSGQPSYPTDRCSFRGPAALSPFLISFLLSKLFDLPSPVALAFLLLETFFCASFTRARFVSRSFPLHASRVWKRRFSHLQFAHRACASPWVRLWPRRPLHLLRQPPSSFGITANERLHCPRVALVLFLTFIFLLCFSPSCAPSFRSCLPIHCANFECFLCFSPYILFS